MITTLPPESHLGQELGIGATHSKLLLHATPQDVGKMIRPMRALYLGLQLGM